MPWALNMNFHYCIFKNFVIVPLKATIFEKFTRTI
jgi:hypothetical protein